MRDYKRTGCVHVVVPLNDIFKSSYVAYLLCNIHYFFTPLIYPSRLIPPDIPIHNDLWLFLHSISTLSTFLSSFTFHSSSSSSSSSSSFFFSYFLLILLIYIHIHTSFYYFFKINLFIIYLFIISF